MPARQYKYVMRCVAHTGIVRNLADDSRKAMHIGDYLQAYDPEFMNGAGLATWTTNPEHALLFTTKTQAMDLWKTVPRSKPRRADGEPNRPLTAYSVEVLLAEDAIQEYKEAASRARSSRRKSGGST